MSFRPERSRSKVIAAVVAVAAVAGLAFFLLGPSGRRFGGPIAKAATVSSRAAGYRMRMSIQLTSSALSAPITATGGGVVDVRDHATSLSLLMDLGDDPQVIQQLGGSTMRIDTITHGSVVYVKLPAVLTSAPRARDGHHGPRPLWPSATACAAAGRPGAGPQQPRRRRRLTRRSAR